MAYRDCLDSWGCPPRAELATPPLRRSALEGRRIQSLHHQLQVLSGRSAVAMLRLP